MGRDLHAVLDDIRVQMAILDDGAETQIAGDRGSKKAGAEARKASNELTKLMKEFRAKSNELAKA